MELALLTGSLRCIETLDSPSLDRLVGDDFGDPDLASLDRLTREILREKDLTCISRVQFGNEFCQKLLPSPAELERAVAASERLGLAFTLVTPYATDAGLADIRRLIDALPTHDRTTELVVNDLGVLRLVRKSRDDLTPVLGRLIDKMMRDPRTGPYYNAPDAPPHALAALRRPAVTSDDTLHALIDLGIARVELDQVHQGIDLDEAAGAIALSIHVPYAFVASGRICMSGSYGQRRHEKFAVGDACSHECQDLLFRLGNESSPYDDRSMAVYERGNGLFSLHDETMLRESIEELPGHGVDRIIFTSELPMRTDLPRSESA